VRLGVLGAGAVGVRALRQWLATPDVEALFVAARDPRRAERVATSLGERVRPVDVDQLVGVPDLDAVVLAVPAPQVTVALRLLRAGTSVVSVADEPGEVRDLLALDSLAKELGVALVVGGGFMPGLTCLLARYAAGSLDQVDEIHVAKHGTGGPACARQHHRALGSTAIGWSETGWLERAGGSGRELCWFPDPVGALDCYRAGLPDPLLLVPAFPGVSRVSARVSATRRDRLTARLPMLWPTDPEGGLGAVRVELRGSRGSARAVEVVGALDWPAVAAGGVAAVAALAAARGTIGKVGAFGLADPAVPATSLLADLADRGVKAARFTGVTAEL
jgi:hypothetical protein